MAEPAFTVKVSVDCINRCLSIRIFSLGTWTLKTTDELEAETDWNFTIKNGII